MVNYTTGAIKSTTTREYGADSSQGGDSVISVAWGRREGVAHAGWEQEQRRKWEAKNRAALRMQERDVVFDRG